MNTQQGKTAARQRAVSSRSSSGKQKRAHKRYRLKASVRRKLAILGVLAGLIVIALLLLWLWPAQGKNGSIIPKACSCRRSTALKLCMITF